MLFRSAMAPEIRVKKYSRPMIVFSAYIKCLFANAYFIRGDYVTHSPRMIFTHSPRRSYIFAPNDLCIRPKGVKHSPRMIYAFAPKLLRIRLGEQNTNIRVTRAWSGPLLPSSTFIDMFSKVAFGGFNTVHPSGCFCSVWSMQFTDYRNIALPE